MQNLSTYGASAATFLSVEGRDFLVVSNYGTEGNREINSTVYQFSDSGQLEEVQVILDRLSICVLTYWYCFLSFTRSKLLQQRVPVM